MPPSILPRLFKHAGLGPQQERCAGIGGFEPLFDQPGHFVIARSLRGHQDGPVAARARVGRVFWPATRDGLPRPRQMLALRGQDGSHQRSAGSDRRDLPQVLARAVASAPSISPAQKSAPAPRPAWRSGCCSQSLEMHLRDNPPAPHRCRFRARSARSAARRRPVRSGHGAKRPQLADHLFEPRA